LSPSAWAASRVAPPAGRRWRSVLRPRRLMYSSAAAGCDERRRGSVTRLTFAWFSAPWRNQIVAGSLELAIIFQAFSLRDRRPGRERSWRPFATSNHDVQAPLVRAQSWCRGRDGVPPPGRSRGVPDDLPDRFTSWLTAVEVSVPERKQPGKGHPSPVVP